MAKSTEKSFWLSRRGLAAISLIGFASYFLVMEHSQHLFEYLPFLILLLCPLMHLFMHGGHGHKQGATDNTKPQSTQSDSEVPYSESYEQGRKDALGDDSEGGRSHGQR